MRLAESMIREIAMEGGDGSAGYIEWAPGYAEPGYSAGDAGVYFANWNPKEFQTMRPGASPSDPDWKPGVPSFESRVGAILEALGIDVEWSDEWSNCEGCNRAVRTEPDSYSWTASFAILNDCELLCRECILEDPDEWEAQLADSPGRADTFGVNWAERGWKPVERCETGLHPGQDDSPEEVYHRLAHPTRSVLFSIDSVGQFDTSWSAWVRDVEAPEDD